MSKVKIHSRGYGVRRSTVFQRMLGVEHTVIEDVELESGDDGREVLVVRVRPTAHRRGRCTRCDFGTLMAFVESGRVRSSPGRKPPPLPDKPPF